MSLKPNSVDGKSLLVVRAENDRALERIISSLLLSTC